MPEDTTAEAERDFDFGAAIGASRAARGQKLTVYIPSKTKDNVEFGTQRMWVLKAFDLLAKIGGGASAVVTEGVWLNAENDQTVREETVLVYTYCEDADKLIANCPALKQFLYELGRETEQGQIFVEFDSEAYVIDDTDY